MRVPRIWLATPLRSGVAVHSIEVRVARLMAGVRRPWRGSRRYQMSDYVVRPFEGHQKISFHISLS